MGQCWLCEAVFWRSAFKTRRWLTSEAAWDKRALNGNGQCWLSVRLWHFRSHLNTAAFGYASFGLGASELVRNSSNPEAPELVREPLGHASFGLGADQNWSAAGLGAAKVAKPRKLPQPPLGRSCAGRFRVYIYNATLIRASAGLHDVLCRSRSSRSFGLRVAVVERSAKTLAFRV